MSSLDFWQGKRVFITGHTGFKGSWLCLWLAKMGAKIKGFSLQPTTEPSLFTYFCNNIDMESVIGDVRDLEKLKNELNSFSPDIIIHLAAQALVRVSYINPIDTYSTNVIGTVNLFEAAKYNKCTKVILNVTTDKCYKNNEWHWGYRENEPLGGDDPYSSSKACSELITSAYTKSFFEDGEHGYPKINVVTARAGNVIGGGDWAEDRLMTDLISSLITKENIILRNPYATRPWQHVYDAISGYLSLIERAYKEPGKYKGSWNFGPNSESERNVLWLANQIIREWGEACRHEIEKNTQPHEALYLKLDCSKAHKELGWYPVWGVEESIQDIVSWYKFWRNKKDNVEEVFRYSEMSLNNYLSHRKHECNLKD